MSVLYVNSYIYKKNKKTFRIVKSWKGVKWSTDNQDVTYTVYTVCFWT